MSRSHVSKPSAALLSFACLSALAVCCPQIGQSQESPAPPAVPSPRPLAATIVKIESEASAVKVARLDALTCELPCELSVPPGPHRLSYSAKGEHVTNLAIPASGAQVTIEDPRISYYVWGGILTPIGLGIGSGMWLLFLSCSQPLHADVPRGCILAHQITWPLVGAGLVATGIYLFAAARRMAPRPVLKPLEQASFLRRNPPLFDVAPSQAGVSTSVAFRF